MLIFRDVTERRRAEKERALLAGIVESSEDPIISKSLDGTIESWNEAAERLYGYSAGEAIGQPITIIIPPERVEEERAILERLRRGERIEHFETARISKSGRRLDVSLTVSPVRDAEGRIVGASKIARDIGERKRAQQELLESRERLRMAMEASQMGTWTRELDETNRTRWSPELERIFGFGPGEFPETEEAFFDLVHPDDRDALRKAVAEAIQNHTDYIVEFRYTRKGETRPRWMAGRGRAFYDANGTPFRLAGFGWDITERKQMEEALRQQREWLQVTLSSIGDAVITTDTDGFVTFLNPVAESLTGWKQVEAQRQPLEKVFRIVNEQSRERVENPALRAMEEGVIVGLANHTVLIAKDGAEIPIDDSGAPIKDADGNILGAVLIFRDVTERRLAEDRFRLAVESSPAAQVMIDEQGRIVLVNSQTERLFGYAREELMGQPIEILVPERFRGRHREYRTEFFHMPQTRPMGAGRDLFGLRKDGSEVPVEIGLNPIEMKGHTLILSSIVDITERKRAEEERARLLASEHAAREQAEAASRAKDEFVAVVSHEIRSPLNAILGWAQMLRTGKFDQAETARAIEVIERNAKAQMQIIEDLMDISRVITGRLSLTVRPVDPAQVVEAAIETLRPAADAKAIHLDAHLDPKGSLVTGDPNRLQQIVWNLLSNAVKFTPRLGRIGVRVERIDSQLQISVSDSGAGISPEFLPFVFDRFSQASTGSQRRQGGLGLGLAIVRHLVELHGGTVRAESPGEGRGATFTVALPVRAVREEMSDFEGADASAGRDLSLTDAIMLDGLRVMIVDDEAEMRDLLAAILTRRGAEVKACASAAEALEAVEQWRPFVIVSDIRMPDEDGYSLIRKLRALGPQRGGNTPAVALTAYAKSEDRLRSLAAGFQMHVTKPVEAEELILVIASLAGRASKGAR